MVYTPKIIKNCICNYHGITPSDLLLCGFEDIVCILVDIDKAINISLSPREIQVVNTIKEWGEKIAPSILEISCHTIKFHLANACNKISKYLNGDILNG